MSPIIVLASALALLIYSGVFVIISGTFGVALSPFETFQQMKVTQSTAMVETNAFFERQLEILKKNIQNLSGQVAALTKCAGRLQQMEKTLGTVQAMSGDCL